jgi:hypothetical protein
MNTLVVVEYIRIYAVLIKIENLKLLVTYLDKSEITNVGSNFVFGGGGLISQERLLGHHFPLKLYRLSLVYKLYITFILLMVLNPIYLCK